MEKKEEEENNFSNEGVKSKAVVKYSVPCPANFTKLQCNTDLNLPPSNWLSSSIDYYGLQRVLYQPGEFSSFKMAHMFPDCVGEVDVVSDAENIKQLLKIPYHKGSVSMMVHRVENTLLLDDFDIYKHLLRTAEAEWEWLRRFFYENVKNTLPSDQVFDRTIYFKNKSRKALNQKSLISKFLYHSLADSDECKTISVDDRKNYPLAGPVLPEPSEEIPDSSSQDHKYNRNVIWTFEDIQMLIGTDMPIFGGGTHPCVSLRLREMSKPINILTGIDYWLDNLMSNVPEVVMCYHLNGIVQKYELIKTEDLPRLDNSKFSPKVIREVAKSILSFLKSNATKAGHTYWLFKPKDEDVVKLYDLTSLCSKYMVEKDENPFTIPVAMLLYRVARNMKHSRSKQQPGTIRMLLKNCIKLLSEEKYPEIVTSSHYMLSDLYIPTGTDPESPTLDQEESESDNEFSYVNNDDIEENTDSATNVLILDSDHLHDEFINHYKKPQPINGSLEERCLQAIHHVAAGLACLKYFPQDRSSEKENQTYEEANVRIPRSNEPIPMPYAKLNEENLSDAEKKNGKKNSKKRKDKSKKKCDTLISELSLHSSENALLLKNNTEAQPLPTWQDNYENISWKNHLKTLLYEKIVLIYATLAEQNYLNANYGSSLRYLGLLVRCHQVLKKLLYNSNNLMENCLLGRAGDCCIMIAHNWDKIEKYKSEFHAQTDEDQNMICEIEKDEQYYSVNYVKLNIKCVLIYDIRTVEQMLMKGVECYEQALKYCETNNSILRRLGNSLNELGNYYLNQTHNSNSVSFILQCCNKAEPYLKKGLELFEKVKDVSNIALLYANLGHLNRVLAYAYSPLERTELTTTERVHYNKAFMNYKKALQVLGDKKQNPSVWDSVTWELCSTYFILGTILHENPSNKLSRAEAEKEVTEMFHQSLKYCDLDENNPKCIAFQQRAASIHYRLGSLYHSSVWNYPNDASTKKNAVHLAKLHYKKAASLFFTLSDGLNYLTVQMQRFALLEHLGETAVAPQAKFNHFQECLQILIEVGSIIELVVKKEIEIEEVDEAKTKAENGSFKSFNSLVMLLKERIQYVLRFLLKLSMSKSLPNKDCSKLIETYKYCYSLTLGLDSKICFTDFLKKLLNVILEIQEKINCLNENNKTI